MTIPLYSFGVTAEQLAKIGSGELLRYGTLLKDSQTGQIVAHIQETNLWRNALSMGGETLKGTVASGNPILSIFNTVQNEQIKSRLASLESMMGGMQNLQLLSLTTSVVGIGVTVASTAIIMNRLSSLADTTDKIVAKVDRLPAMWEESRIRDRLASMQTGMERLEESRLRSDRDQVLRNVEESLHSDFTHFSNATAKISLEAEIDANLLRILLSALSLTAGAQFKALLFLNEKDAALHRARAQANTIVSLSWDLPQDIIEQKTGDAPQVARDISQDLKDLRAHLASRPSMVETLIAKDIHGRDWIETAQNEDEEPLLLLPRPT